MMQSEDLNHAKTLGVADSNLIESTEGVLNVIEIESYTKATENEIPFTGS
jgi:hypothetical protein